jgi:hypothetical protein
MSEAGLSWKTARPEFYKSDERAQEAWQEGSILDRRENIAKGKYIWPLEPLADNDFIS